MPKKVFILNTSLFLPWYFFACPKKYPKKDTFLRSSRPQAKGQPRREKIASAPIPPAAIEVIITLFVTPLFVVYDLVVIVVLTFNSSWLFYFRFPLSYPFFLLEGVFFVPVVGVITNNHFPTIQVGDNTNLGKNISETERSSICHKFLSEGQRKG
ncbi:hypothetical protein QNI19_38790 [Cytophagaceae bacterium DM2B3-1]|uniref:Uncharacterized protein n=1 Tax=Xanthocytophaga flava TaxID=3048013 RepID=A0ABT7CYX2_9BACT|nr:hypothetical protein [Xanthocytophaga flavus]MDJ1498938.1 hypothetical protein [Xanthocytophaga flavus]